MTTPKPETETPARPQFTMETGRYYPDGSINWLTPEVTALANCPEDRTPAVGAVNFHAGPPLQYGVHILSGGRMAAYPIKPGTYPVDVHLIFTLKDPEAVSATVGGGVVTVDLVVTGQPLGTEYDREVLGHLHPGIPALFANTESIKEATDSQWLRITSIERQIAEDES